MLLTKRFIILLLINYFKATHSNSEMRDIAARICRDYLTGAWKTISAEEIQLRRISGGLSNFLYYVSLPEGKMDGSPPRPNINCSKRPRRDSYHNILEPKEVLLRIYGQTHGEHALETMLTESVVFTLLSERKLGPKLHGVFPGGRIEQYIPARPLLTSELADAKISTKIAEKMAEIHSLDIPVSKEPDWIWITMNRWLNNLDTIFRSPKRNVDNNNSDNAQIKSCFAAKLSQIDFRKEVEWLRKIVEVEDYQVTFSHNDLQEGNILFREKCSPAPSIERFGSFDDSSNLDSDFSSIIISSSVKSNSSGNMDILNGNNRKRSLVDDDELNENNDSALSGTATILLDRCDPELMIIDFEYCAYNYRGFDLANHFLEWTYDYTNDQYPYFHHKKHQYPTHEQKEKFVMAYLTKISGELPTLNEKMELYDEITCFSLASHLFWGLWAIVNVQQEIEFGYWDYANCRISEYLLAKENYLSMKPNSGNLFVLDDCQK